MKFILKGPFKENIYVLMRRIGYFPKDNSFVRPPRGYPRFHIYLKAEGEESKLSSSPFTDAREKNDLIFNLHLDQKRPSYKGTTAHSGEYRGKIVEAEAERIKQILNAEN